jgi:RND family efflux transporter MFP subunit
MEIEILVKGFRLLVIFFLFSLIACNNGEPDPGAEQLGDESHNIRGIPVEGLVIKARDVHKDITLSGLLDPKNSVDLVAEVAGKIIKINKKLGDSVKKSDILAQIDDVIPLNNFKQAKSQVLSAENNLNIAKLNLLSDEELYKSGDISKLEYENSLLSVKTAEANHLSALATLSVLEKTYNDTRVKSPINGYISRKYVDLGTMVTSNSILYRVVDISSLKIEVGVSQKMVSYIKPGMEAKIEISALSNQVFSGQIKYISPQSDENTGAFTVEIYVDNTKDNKIKAGMTARVVIVISNQKEQILIPDHALITRNDSSFVYVVSDKKVSLTPIKIRDNFDSFYTIDDGILSGDTIVVVGMKKLNDGSPVWIELLNE